MKRIVAFSKYLTYDIGGAETSTRSLLLEKSRVGSIVHVVSLKNARFLGRLIPQAHLPQNWHVLSLKGIQLSRFSYVEYLLNRIRVLKYFSHFEADELWAYGIWAPAALLGFNGKKCYFIRSETDLGIVGNYFNGINKFAKCVYTLLEKPVRKMYEHDLQRVMQDERVTVVANSHYMAGRAKKLFGVDAEVMYPHVDVEQIRGRLDELAMEPNWVVFVGDSTYKGIDLVLEMARCLKNVQFRIFSRFVESQHQENNILWSPWQTENWKVYYGARLVIVPSQWEEAYGRVAREAYLLGIPVLVSNVGGLPEAVEKNKKCLVSPHDQVKSWVEKITQNGI